MSYKKYTPNLLTIKLKATKFFKKQDHVIIQKAIETTHEITQRVSLLLKAYYIKFYNETSILEINRDLIHNCFQVVQGFREKPTRQVKEKTLPEDEIKKQKRIKKLEKVNDEKSKQKALFPVLKECYDQLFQGYVENTLSLSFVLEYNKQLLETCYQNNITFNYSKYIKRFLVAYYPDKKQKQVRWDLFKFLTLKDQPIPSTEELAFCKKHFGILIDWDKQSTLTCFLEKKPWICLHHMIYLMKHIEENIELDVKLLSPFCLKRSFILSHIRLDTSGLVQLLMTKDRIKEFKTIYDLANSTDLKVTGLVDILGSFETISGIEDPEKQLAGLFSTEIWKFLCNFENKHYKDILEHKRKEVSYVFNNSVCTDGCSISFSIIQKTNLKRKTFSKGRTLKKKNKDENGKVIHEFTRIEDLNIKEIEEILLTRTKVSADPGKGNLLQLTKGTENYCYSSGKRNQDMKKKIREKLRQEIEEQVDEVYKENLSRTCANTLNFRLFVEYVKAKYSGGNNVRNIYKLKAFRNDRYRASVLQKSSEDKFIKELRKFTESEKTKIKTFNWLNEKEKTCSICKNIKQNPENKKPVIFYGCWGNLTNLKNSAPSPGISLKRKVAKAFDVIEVSEHYTSQTCPCCRTLSLEHPKPEKDQGRKYLKERHQLLRCTNVNCYSRWWSRDILGSFNILYKTIEDLVERKTNLEQVLSNG